MLADPVSEQIPSDASLKLPYVDALKRIERLHRLVLDLIRNEFDQIGWDDITPVQALLLFNIGKHEVAPRELRARGYYLGSNVSYNLRKLVDGLYIHHERSPGSRRSVRLRLTPKGEEVAETVQEMFDRHLERIALSFDVDPVALDTINLALAGLERFWRHQEPLPPATHRGTRGPSRAVPTPSR